MCRAIGSSCRFDQLFISSKKSDLNMYLFWTFLWGSLTYLTTWEVNKRTEFTKWKKHWFKDHQNLSPFYLESNEDTEAIIAGVVPGLAIVILIAVGIIVWLKYFHRKRMRFIQREFEDAVASGRNSGALTNHYDFQQP